MTREEAIKFAVHAQTMTDVPEVKEFYAMAETALRNLPEQRHRFTQQCSGPRRNMDVEGHCCPVAVSRISFQRLMDSVKCDDFPVYVKQGSGGIWSFTNEKDSFGTEIKSMEEMRQFYHEYAW